MIDEERKIVSTLTGIAPEKIGFSDDGFLSRGYIIDDGRIVFKFKKWPEISYKNEARILSAISSLKLGATLQKIGWTSENDEYLGLYGVVGDSIKSHPEGFGQQIGDFLKNLHSIKLKNINTVSLEKEFAVWADRFTRSKDVLARYFTDVEIARMESFVTIDAPKELLALGENLVFSHGDFCLGNIFADKTGKLGIIDFSEAAYMDEAVDFMDMENDELAKDALSAYGADKNLRKKVAIRRAAHPMFTISTYRDRPESKLEYFINKIGKWLS